MENNSIEIEPSDKILVKSSVSLPVFTSIPLKVNAHPRAYSIVGQDVYTIKRNSSLEPWFEDQINNLIDTGNLADEVSDLDNRFVNFQDGVTLEIGYLQTADEKLAYDLSVIKVSNENNTAAIQNLNVVKVTEDEASAIASSTIGAWQNGAGGAWFDSRVAVVSNVAYSAAKSASTLTASLDSQADLIQDAFYAIDDLSKQVDGVVETLFYDNLATQGPTDVIGNILLDQEPYLTWLTEDILSLHTGDTYVLYEIQPNGEKTTIDSWRFGRAVVNEPTTDANGYVWLRSTSSKADEAYNAALAAQGTADGKIVTYFQEGLPYLGKSDVTDTLVIQEEDKKVGDLLVESDNNNKLWRYNRSPITGGTSVTYKWQPVDDLRVEASVTRLDEATVDVNGESRAKSSLSVNANGAIAGFVAESDGTTSKFRIMADQFSIANSENQNGGEPFTIDTTTGQIQFTGNVTFKGTLVDSALQPGDAAFDINNGTTEINGGKIQTNTLNANTIIAGGRIYSPLIEGGIIKGVEIIGSVIKGSYIDLSESSYLTNWKTISTYGYDVNFAKDPTTGELIKTDDGKYFRLPKVLPLTTGTSTITIPATPVYQDGNNVRYEFVSGAVASDGLYSWNSYKVDTNSRLLSESAILTPQGEQLIFDSSSEYRIYSSWGPIYGAPSLNYSVSFSFNDGYGNISMAVSDIRTTGTRYVSSDGINLTVEVSEAGGCKIGADGAKGFRVKVYIKDNTRINIRLNSENSRLLQSITLVAAANYSKVNPGFDSLCRSSTTMTIPRYKEL